MVSVAVIGLGFVGKELAKHFYNHGYCVVGVDTDKNALERLRIELQPQINQSTWNGGILSLQSDYSGLEKVPNILVCLPTDVTEDGAPDLTILLDGLKSLAPHIAAGQLISIESTVYPGATKGVIQKFLIDQSGHKDFFLVCSPERVDPTNTQYDIGDIPKLVGGVDKGSTMVARRFYGHTFQVVEVTANEAELAKLVENSFRLVNIGLANEWAQLAKKLRVNIWTVINAASTKPFGFMPFYPGPGVGGNCIPVNPKYLTWSGRKHHSPQHTIKHYDAVNENQPQYIVNRLAEHFDGELKGKTVLLVGMAYKANTSDTRNSPSVDVAKLLIERGAFIFYHDPLVPAINISGGRWQSDSLTEERFDYINAVVLLTAHTDIDYAMIVGCADYIFDTRNILGGFGSLPNIEIL